MTASRPRTPSPRLRVQQLEDRLTPSWSSIPPTTVAVPSIYTNVVLNASGDATGSAAVTAGEVDWYRFTVPAGRVILSAATPNSNLDTVIGLYNSTGGRVGYNDNYAWGNPDSRYTITLVAGTYFLGVTNKTGTPNGSYTWAVDGPIVDDKYENNDIQTYATDLGAVAAARTVTGLALADADWFEFTVPAGTGGSAAIAFDNAQGNVDLKLVNAAGTQLAASAGTGNAESVSLAGLAAGTYWVQVYSADGRQNPSYSLTITPPAATPAAGGFSITLRTTGMTATQQAVFQQAADRWAQVILGDLPDTTYNGVAVDDLLIDASAAAIDGAYGILGQAGPDAVRSGSRLPYHGVMEFDSADLARLEASGGLYYTVLHEMGHVLGIGTLWQSLGLLGGAGGSDPRFLGLRATAEYNARFGVSEAGVPVENTGGAGTRDGHWRESVFDTEVMTGWLDAGALAVSRVTVASLADMGYAVNLDAADPF